MFLCWGRCGDGSDTEISGGGEIWGQNMAERFRAEEEENEREREEVEQKTSSGPQVSCARTAAPAAADYFSDKVGG